MKLQHAVSVAVHDFQHMAIFLPECSVVLGAGVIRTGLAVDQIQLCSLATKETNTLLQSFVAMGDYLYQNGFAAPRYQLGRTADATRQLRFERWHHPHTQAMIKPLYAPDEFGSQANQLVCLADKGFTSIDFDVTKYTPEAQLLRLNLLNLVGPVVLDQLHRSGFIPREADTRHLLWRYASRQERTPFGWRWQPSVSSYQQTLIPLTSIFAYTEERSKQNFVFPSGIFHYATLVSFENKTFIRFTALPSLPPRQIIHFVSRIDRWLVRTVKAVGARTIGCADEAAVTARFYNRRRLPTTPSTRLYFAER